MKARNNKGVLATKCTVSFGHTLVGKNVFYCGKEADYSCRRCDGICGPNDGCQCLACAELTEISETSGFINSNGACTNLSFDDWHSQGYKHYCGKLRGYRCTSCDGQCGPNNGCQCSACLELTLVNSMRPPNQKKNRDGNLSWISFDNYHKNKLLNYCGKQGDYSCSQCDGICGPTNGCQCKSCELLSSQMPENPIQLETRNGFTFRSFDTYHTHKIQYYCGKYRDVPCVACDKFCGPKDGCPCSSCNELTSKNEVQLFNSQGNRTWTSFDSVHSKTFKRYCGKRGNYNCLQCDGICGPTHGCNCSSCDELDGKNRTSVNNSTSNVTFVSFDNVHSGAYRHYCGKPAPLACPTCPKLCGPAGCQCTACAALDAPAIVQTIPKAPISCSPALHEPAPIEDEDDEKLCVICFSSQRTASIVHGETGHQICCMECAKDLKAKNHPCPFCRQPIEFVIRNFT